MYKGVIAAILAALLVVPILAEEEAAEEIEWVASFDEAAALAKQTNRHLVTNVFSPT